MSRRGLAAAIVLALVAFYFARQGSSRDSSEPASKLAHPAPKSLAQRREARRAGRIDTSRASVSGRVVRADSRDPIEGATLAITLRRIDGGVVGRAGRSPAPLVARSNSQGRFRIADLGAGAYSLSASAEGFRPRLVEGLQLAGGEHKDDIVFLLEEGGHTLQGRVSDIGGGPVPGALVRAKRFSDFSVGSLVRAPFTARTDGEGHYRLSLMDGSYSLSVVHPDYQTSRRSLAMDGRDRRMDMEMTPGGVIEGVVLRRSDDQPVEGAQVSFVKMGQLGGYVVSGAHFNGAAQSDAQGRFSLRGLGTGAFELRAVSPHTSSKTPTVVELGIAESATDVEVYVDEAYTVSGFVVASENQDRPEAGVMVGAYNMQPGALFAASDPSAPDGYFEIHGVHPGSYTLGAIGEERLPNPFGSSATVIDGDVRDVVVKVEGGYTLRGRVEPAARATIKLGMEGEKIGFGNIVQAAGAFLAHAESAQDGTFILRGVSAGSFVLSARSENGRRGTLAVEVSGDRDQLVVPLTEGGAIAGVVVDEDENPVDGARVHMEPRGKEGFSFSALRRRMRPTLTGKDGRFERIGLADGRYGLTVVDGSQLAWAGKTGDAARAPRSVTVEKGQRITDLRLVVESRNGVIAGMVRDPDGSPLADAWVTARPSRGRKIGKDSRRRRYGPKEGPVLTDGAGRFRIEKLRNDTYDLSAEGLRGSATGHLEGVRPGEDVILQVEALSEIVGRVSEAGAPVPSYVVEARGPTWRRARVVDGEGRFRLRRMEPGRYRVSVTSVSGSAFEDVEVAVASSAEVHLSLASFGAISGVLVDAETQEALAGYAVLAAGKRSRDWGQQAMEIVRGESPRSDEAGRFRVDGLGAGEVELIVLDPDRAGFRPVARRTVRLAAGQDLDLGTVEGRPLEGTKD